LLLELGEQNEKSSGGGRGGSSTRFLGGQHFGRRIHNTLTEKSTHEGDLFERRDDLFCARKGEGSGEEICF